MKRLNRVRPTEAMLTDVLAKSMPGRVYNLSAGDPNLPVCDALRAAYLSANMEATHNYGASIGMKSLREKLWSRPEEVIIANGAKQLIYMSLAAITVPGDKVVIIGPCWTSYMRICELLGLRYTLVVGKPEDLYVPSIEDVLSAIDPDTAAVLLNNPNNPTGAVYSEAFLRNLLDAVRSKSSRLISDEIYRLLSSRPFTSLRGEKDVIVIDGFSKSLSITGWRLGYAIAEEDVISAMTGIQSQMSGPPSTLIQNIVDSAFDKLEFRSFSDYKDRIDLLCGIPKFAAARPEAGFYFYLSIDDRWESSRALCEHMLKEHSIAITPGDEYGVPRTVRISVAYETAEALNEIVDRLRII